MEILIRAATENDFPAILSLIRELARFEKAPEKVTNTVELMKEEQQYFRCLVAETGEKEIIGMALFYMVYYTWVGKSLYLDDLYVNEKLRKQGVGASLLREVFRIATEENCKRVRWQVLDWNQPAIGFYRKCGAAIDSEWLNCTFDEKAISDFSI